MFTKRKNLQVGNEFVFGGLKAHPDVLKSWPQAWTSHSSVIMFRMHREKHQQLEPIKFVRLCRTCFFRNVIKLGINFKYLFKTSGCRSRLTECRFSFILMCLYSHLVRTIVITELRIVVHVYISKYACKYTRNKKKYEKYAIVVQKRDCT